MRKRQSMLMTMSCRGGCGTKLTTLAQPIHASDQSHATYHGYCDQCLARVHGINSQHELANAIVKDGLKI